MHERLRGVLADVFGCSPAEIPADAGPEALPGWDSLRHLELMLAIEIEFGVTIETAAVSELMSLDAIAEYLEGQGITQAA